jgi:hypothetical protein
VTVTFTSGPRRGAQPRRRGRPLRGGRIPSRRPTAVDRRPARSTGKGRITATRNVGARRLVLIRVLVNLFDRVVLLTHASRPLRLHAARRPRRRVIKIGRRRPDAGDGAALPRGGARAPRLPSTGTRAWRSTWSARRRRVFLGLPRGRRGVRTSGGVMARLGCDPATLRAESAARRLLDLGVRPGRPGRDWPASTWRPGDGRGWHHRRGAPPVRWAPMGDPRADVRGARRRRALPARPDGQGTVIDLSPSTARSRCSLHRPVLLGRRACPGG